MKAFMVSRWAMALLIAVGFWTNDCARPTSITARLEHGLKHGETTDVMNLIRANLRGSSRPLIPAELAPDLRTFAFLFPSPEDRQEVASALFRDIVFIGSYLLAYLALAWLLSHRSMTLAIIAVIFTVAAAACNLTGDYFTCKVLDHLTKDYGTDVGNAKLPIIPDSSDAQSSVNAMRISAYGKWLCNFAVIALLAFVFLRATLCWPTVCGGLLFLAGILGLAGTSGALNPGWSLKYHNLGFLLTLAGSLLATILLFSARDKTEFFSVRHKLLPQ